MVFGICGGYQMLGESIYDPEGMEHEGEVRGIGLLPVRTVFETSKQRTRVSGQFLKTQGILGNLEGVPLEGYEIHMGTTTITGDGHPLVVLNEGRKEKTLDGAQNGNVYGCYIHGIFDHPKAAKAIVSALYRQKGLDETMVGELDLKQYKEKQYDLLADVIRENMDMKMVYEIIEKGMNAPWGL